MKLETYEDKTDFLRAALEDWCREKWTHEPSKVELTLYEYALQWLGYEPLDDLPGGRVAWVGEDENPVRAMYRRLAAEYRATEPTVPDRRGGVKGDRYPF